MTKIAVFFLIIINLLPFSASTKAKFENTLKSKFSYAKQTTQASQLSSDKPKFTLTPEPKGQPSTIERGKAQFAIDLATGSVITENNADARLQVASLTKLMTAYTALKDIPLDKEITVGKFELRSGDAVVGLNQGEKLDFESLLTGTLINSGSDGAQAIALADAGSIESFVTKMNQNAKYLGLKNTHFANPVGWDDQNNYSSARDLAELSRILLGNPTFRQIVSTNYTSITTKEGRKINLVNTDVLLADPNYIGVKTGFTYGAGECLISLNKRTGREILTVVIGSSDRFGQTRAFFDWINSNFVLK